MKLNLDLPKYKWECLYNHLKHYFLTVIPYTTNAIPKISSAEYQYMGMKMVSMAKASAKTVISHGACVRFLFKTNRMIPIAERNIGLKK